MIREKVGDQWHVFVGPDSKKLYDDFKRKLKQSSEADSRPSAEDSTKEKPSNTKPAEQQAVKD